MKKKYTGMDMVITMISAKDVMSASPMQIVEGEADYKTGVKRYEVPYEYWTEGIE